MSILEAVFLGIVQGLAEFLPISSSGHLVLFQKILGISAPSVSFDIFLHVATLIAVFAVFWKDIWALIRKPFQKTTYLIIVGTLPLVLIALLFKSFIDSMFSSGIFLGVNFLITALLLMLADNKQEGTKTVETMNYSDAGIVGIMQAIAVAPAISRSGATIVGSLFAGLNRESAAKFSFLISIPAILGGFVLELKDVISEGTDFFALGMAPMMFGFVAAAVSGFFAIKIMLSVIKKSKLVYFSYYVFTLGILIILDQTIFHVFF